VFYASGHLNDPFAFWASFLPECCTLLQLEMSLMLLGFVPSGTLYASVISNEPLAFGIYSFWNIVHFRDFK
jgi:hypothetical protein